MLLQQMLLGYGSSSSSEEKEVQQPCAIEEKAPVQKQALAGKRKLPSISGALSMIDHGVQQEASDSEGEQLMKLSKTELEMQGHIKSKMRYAGETYHRVAPAQVEINLLKTKRKPEDQEQPEDAGDVDSYNTVEFQKSGFTKYHKTDADFKPSVIENAPTKLETPEVVMKQTEIPKRRAFTGASVRAKQRGQDPKSLITE